MKLRTGLAAVLSLVISTSMIAFAEDNISNLGPTENPKPSEVVTGEIINQAPTEGAEVVQPPKDVPEVEVPPAVEEPAKEPEVVVPPVVPPTEEPEVVVPPAVPPTEEPEVVVPPVVPPTEEPEVVVPPVVPPTEEPEVVVPPAEVPVVVPPVVEVKPATLTVKHILMYQGVECDVNEEVIGDLKIGDIVNNMKFVRSEEKGYFDIVCLEESQEVALTEKSEIVIRYNYVGTLDN